MASPVSSPPATCPPEETLAAFCEGVVDAEQLGAVEAHLDTCSTCSAVVAAALGGGAPEPGTTRLSALTFRPGQTLRGRYEIVRFIARGGMGEVYEAEDRRLNRRVALKTVTLATSNDARAMERLGREVRLARRVSHPNVCQVFELEAGPDGAFVTMELLEGETLGARIRREGALPAHELAALLPALVAALAAAHRAGVVHRDLKSDNVMLCEPIRHPGRRVCVLDFGLARRTGSNPNTVSTDSRSRAGSAGYMAPEQVRGERGIGPAADIYALGVVVFEALTGRLPFRGDNDTETALLRLTAPPPRLAAFCSDLAEQPAWEAVVAGCLVRDPAGRFAHVEDVLAALAGAPLPSARSAMSRARARGVKARVLSRLLEKGAAIGRRFRGT